MASQQKWYDNKTLMFFLLLFLFPIGVIGIWLKKTTTQKKIAYSIAGFMGWIFVFPITLVIVVVILSPSKESENYYQFGNEAYNDGKYLEAVNYYKNVDKDYEFYDEAIKKQADAQKKYDKEQAEINAYKNQALKEIKINTAPIVQNNKPYSVILYDANLDVKGNDTTFTHQYKILLEDSVGTPYDTLTNWLAVSDTAFDYYINDIGMTLASSTNDNTTSELSSPPGYHNYVGNTRYGSWQTNNTGNPVWEFYGKYAFLRTMLGYNRPVYRGDYDDYYYNYRGRSSYYGQSLGAGKYAYGTRSDHATSLNPRNKFKSTVQTRVARSSSSKLTSMNSFRSSVSNRVSRSSSSSSISRSSSSRTSSYRGGSSSSGK
ncbi:hypothetical protein [Chondrinema litorale]|uniref:hypothetical protein n=1 Tax=Chondrinema litorale TaxID=2994555 RepID=UPI0025433BF1|nr:hypothetical protein [Chondrinema litorale]UZR96050.1 hypothetical protein OQ292_09540 [Chondrinema litorale]